MKRITNPNLLAGAVLLNTKSPAFILSACAYQIGHTVRIRGRARAIAAARAHGLSSVQVRGGGWFAFAIPPCVLGPRR